MGFVALDLELDLQRDLGGDFCDESQLAPLHDDVVAGREVVGDRVQLGRGGLRGTSCSSL